MNLNRIEAKTIRRTVYERLKEAIIQGEIYPGSNISIRKIADQFGISPMPVREALWQLEAEKVIRIEGNRRICISELSPKDMQEALEIRYMLESKAADRACRNRPDACLEKTRTLLEQLNLSINKPKKYLSLNYRFHFAIYSHANAPMLMDFINNIWSRVGPYFYIHISNAKNLVETIGFHKEMYEGFSRKDSERLVRAIRSDISNTAKFIIPFLDGDHSEIPEKLTI